MPELSLKDLREKYLGLAKSQGVDPAISALHNELGKLEGHIYDGGFQADRLARVQALRELSRELYTMKLTAASRHYYEQS
jgi:hypothetical protein